MAKRPGPSFRPNPKLSHFVYKGPEKRDYAAATDRIRHEVEGAPPPPPPPDSDPNDSLGRDCGLDAFLAIMLVLALTIGVMVVLGCDPWGCR